MVWVASGKDIVLCIRTGVMVSCDSAYLSLYDPPSCHPSTRYVENMPWLPPQFKNAETQTLQVSADSNATASQVIADERHSDRD